VKATIKLPPPGEKRKATARMIWENGEMAKRATINPLRPSKKPRQESNLPTPVLETSIP